MDGNLDAHENAFKYHWSGPPRVLEVTLARERVTVVSRRGASFHRGWPDSALAGQLAAPSLVPFSDVKGRLQQRREILTHQVCEGQRRVSAPIVVDSAPLEGHYDRNIQNVVQFLYESHRTACNGTNSAGRAYSSDLFAPTFGDGYADFAEAKLIRIAGSSVCSRLNIAKSMIWKGLRTQSRSAYTLRPLEGHPTRKTVRLVIRDGAQTRCGMRPSPVPGF